jgi:hypothetical protein
MGSVVISEHDTIAEKGVPVSGKVGKAGFILFFISGNATQTKHRLAVLSN